MRNFTMTLLLIVFVFSNCSKDDTYNPYSLTEPEIENLTPIDSSNIIFRKHIVETQSALLSTFVIVVRQAMFQPELYGLVDNNIVETRACPDPSIMDNSDMVDPFDKTLTLNFNEDGSDCTVNGIVYSGSLVVAFEAPLGQSDANAIDVQLTQINSFVANGFAFSGGTIDLETGGDFIYTYTISGAPLVCTKDGVSTSIPVGTTGTFSIANEGEDINSPELWVDNPFELSLDDALITCTGTAATSTFCVNTASNIILDPFDAGGCSCPTDGELLMRDAADCTTTPTRCNAGRTDLGGGTCTGNYSFLESVLEMLSYEGTLTPSNGAASGCPSVETDVSEPGSTPVGESIQRLGGPGSTWTGPSTDSPGDLNTGQVITGSPTLPWINELHYDNTGGDTGEFVEIAGPAGLDLSDYSIEFYNGNGNSLYATIDLTGQIIDDEGGTGFGAISVAGPSGGIQNGAPDGLALVRNASTPIAFTSCQ